MQQHTSVQCPHELRPGITICLHCLRDARLAASALRRKGLLRFARAFLLVLLIAAVGGAGLYFLRSRDHGLAATKPPVTSRIAAATQPVPSSSAPAPVQSASAAEVDKTPVAAPLSPVIAEGVTQLTSGSNATRSGDTVTVNFDTPMLRTRRPEKFEDIVRSTLSEVYGPQAAAHLATIPRGSLVQAEDLFAELPTRGLHIALPSGGTIALWAETRERADGPLVVGYKATVTR